MWLEAEENSTISIDVFHYIQFDLQAKCFDLRLGRTDSQSVRGLGRQVDTSDERIISFKSN